LHHVIPEAPKTTIHEAVTEKLGYRKLCAGWVPKILTDHHKTKLMGSALKILTRYTQERDEFLDSIVTKDETWVFDHPPESKQQSFQWRHTHSPRHSPLAGLWIGAAISNTSHSESVLPLLNGHGSQVKDQGRRQCCNNKHKKFPHRTKRDVSLLS
jgi:hypothetical protein